VTRLAGVMTDVLPSADDRQLFQRAYDIGFAGVEVIVARADRGRIDSVLAAQGETGLAVPSLVLGEHSDLGGIGDADAAVASRRAEGGRIPGLGHPIHKVEDPRTPRIYAIAAEAGLLGPNLRALEMVAAASTIQSGRALPINGAGAGGAALADLGFAPAIVRGFALLARTAGLVAHLAEEMAQPMGMPLFREIDERVTYEPG
jgi:citrate synthase